MKPMTLLTLGVLLLTVANAIAITRIEDNLDKFKNECREDDYTIHQHLKTNDEDIDHLLEDIANLRMDLDGYRFQRVEHKNE